MTALFEPQKCYCDEVGFNKLHDVNPCGRCMTLWEARDYAQIKFAAIIGEFQDENTAFKFLTACDEDERDNVVCVDAAAEIYFSIWDVDKGAPGPITLFKAKLR